MSNLIKLPAIIFLSVFCFVTINCSFTKHFKHRRTFTELRDKHQRTLEEVIESLQTEAEKTAVYFLVGTLSEVLHNKTIIYHDEYAECVVPDQELLLVTQSLISSALSFNQNSHTYENYHNKISLKLPEFAESFGRNFIENCPEWEDYVKQIRDMYNSIAN